MEHLPVHWSEGMFVGPHHFQAGDRYWHDFVATGLRWDNRYNYGVRSLTIVQNSLADFRLQLKNVEARLRDGTLIRAAALELDEQQLKLALQQNECPFIFLGVAKLDLSRVNVGQREARFSADVRETPDENLAGNEQSIEFRRLNCRLFAGAEPPAGFETIPVMRVRRVGVEELKPVVDADYIPPMLDTGAFAASQETGQWAPLSQMFMLEVFHLVGSSLRTLADRVKLRGLSFGASRYPGDLEDLYRLALLNRTYAVLKSYGVERGTHPFEAFTQLCRLYGELVVFDAERRVEAGIPAYDHDNLQPIFSWLKARILRLMPISQIRYEIAPFRGHNDYMFATLKEEWLTDAWQWFLGVKGQNISNASFQELLSRLHWKMASPVQIHEAFDKRLDKHEFTECRQTPRGLPEHEGWIFYEVSKEGPLWAKIDETHELALMVNKKLIVNLDQWQGKDEEKRKIMCVRDESSGEGVALEFSLFALPRG